MSDWAYALDPAGAATYDTASGDSYRDSSAGRTHSDIADPFDLTGARAAEAMGDAQDASLALSYEALGMQKDWQQYIKDEYAPYSEVAGQALTAQKGLAGLGGVGERESMLAGIESDPLYQAKIAAGDDAVLRNASATGGLRSGDANAALAGMNQQLLSREIDARYQKLAGLSGQGFAGQEAQTRYGGEALGEITGTMGNMGSGIVASTAAGQQAQADKQSGAMGLVGGVLSAFSDARLKTNIRELGIRSGLPWYKWDWNDTAGKKFGLRGEAVGFMADEVEQKYPELVIMRDGYKSVVYGGVS